MNACVDAASQSAVTVVPDCHARNSMDRSPVSRRQVSPRAVLLQLRRFPLAEIVVAGALAAPLNAIASAAEKIIPVRLPPPNRAVTVANKSLGSRVKGSCVFKDGRA